MLVDCPDCDRSYHLAAEDIGEHGRVVICPRCGARWFLGGSRPLEDVTTKGAEWAVATSQVAERLEARLGRTGVRLTRLRSALALAVTTLAAITAVEAREPIVRAMPRVAGLYAAIGWPVNLRGLQFSRLTSQGDGTEATSIAGEIRNVAHRRVRVPRVVFEVRDAGGAAILSWSEAASMGTLAGGRTLAFASAPHVLPPTSRKILVSFAEGDALPVH